VDVRLVDLGPQFVQIADDGGFRHVETVAEAHGARFACPCGCGVTIFVCIADRGVPEKFGQGLRWAATGKDYSDLTLTPSIQILRPGCGWHGFITNGEVRNA
jgi:hypothetical protein